MLIAIFSDIHANREAFDACFAHACSAGAERFVLLGDLVGYGADPVYIVDRAIELRTKGALIIKGNHDEAAVADVRGMNSYARQALDWTRGRLDEAQKSFLAGLPLTVEEGEVLYVHSEASEPAYWIYVVSAFEAELSMDATRQRLTFCGHVHRPQVYCRAAGGMLSLEPQTRAAIVLDRRYQWHIVLGSVGQPRDGIAAASYALFDPVTETFSFQRVAYDIEAAARKILEAGLPELLAARLFTGH